MKRRKDEKGDKNRKKKQEEKKEEKNLPFVDSHIIVYHLVNWWKYKKDMFNIINTVKPQFNKIEELDFFIKVNKKKKKSIYQVIVDFPLNHITVNFSFICEYPWCPPFDWLVKI